MIYDTKTFTGSVARRTGLWLQDRPPEFIEFLQREQFPECYAKLVLIARKRDKPVAAKRQVITVGQYSMLRELGGLLSKFDQWNAV